MVWYRRECDVSSPDKNGSRRLHNRHTKTVTGSARGGLPIFVTLVPNGRTLIAESRFPAMKAARKFAVKSGVVAP